MLKTKQQISKHRARRTGKSQQKAKMSSSTPIKSELPAQPAVAPATEQSKLNNPKVHHLFCVCHCVQQCNLCRNRLT